MSTASQPQKSASRPPRYGSGMGQPATSKRSSFACTNCRRRKIRCDAHHPSCRTCILYQDTCTYELPPSLNYVRFLESRIRNLEECILRLAKEGDRSREALLRKAVIADQVVLSPGPHDSLPDNFETVPIESEGNLDEVLDLRIGPEGEVGHHSLTSFYTLPSLPGSSNPHKAHEMPAETASTPLQPDGGDQYVRTRLIQSALEQRPQEILALSKLASGVPEFPLEMYEYLLQCHWKWIQPFYNFIYRPAFTRDMGRQAGQYFSPFLFFSVIAHSARFCKSHRAFQNYAQGHIVGEFFLSKAKSFLSTEIEKPGITTVQGLLLLSANASSVGHRSQAWTYSGMAFRIMTDLGLHLNNAQIVASTKLSDEDLEVRRRLFWSAYLWDKSVTPSLYRMISLYFGRTPALSNSARAPPPLIRVSQEPPNLSFAYQKLVDDSAENDLWVPFLSHENPSLDAPTVPSYPPTPTRGISTFISACSLAEILNEVILAFYCVDSRKSIRSDSRRRTTDKLVADLNAWREKLPDSLWFDTTMKREFPLPSHISNLNALYHTSMILANRPCLISEPGDPQTQSRCLEAASSIMCIVRLWSSSFGECRFMIVAYAVYTAATVFLVLLQQQSCFIENKSIGTEERDRIVSELYFCHVFLLEVTATCPGIEMPARAIKQYLDHLPPGLCSGSTTNAWPAANVGTGQVPPSYGSTSRGTHHDLDGLPISEPVAYQSAEVPQDWEGPRFQHRTQQPSVASFPGVRSNTGHDAAEDGNAMFGDCPWSHLHDLGSSQPSLPSQRQGGSIDFDLTASYMLFPEFLGQDRVIGPDVESQFSHMGSGESTDARQFLPLNFRAP